MDSLSKYLPFENLETFLSEYVFLTDRSTKELKKFQKYIKDEVRQLAAGLIWTFLLLLLITWPTDYFFFEKESIRQAYLYWRVVGFSSILFFFLSWYLSNFVKENILMILGTGSALYTFLTGYIFGSVVSFQSPWFSVIYLLPVIPVPLPVGLFTRILLSHAFPLVYFLGFSLSWPISQFEYAGMQIATIGSACWMSILLGHEFYLILRQNYFQSQELKKERERSEELLYNILPEEISERLKAGEDVSEKFDDVTVLFADIVEFTPIANELEADEVVSILDDMFSRFDDLVNKYDLEKIKTIGDEYFVAAGVPEPTDNHALRMANLAYEMQTEVHNHKRHDGSPFRLRCGMNTGPLVAGIIGKEKFVYDVWGDTVNIGSRMESQGEPGEVQVTPATKHAIEEQDDEGQFEFEKRGTIQVKGKGEMTTYFLQET